MDGSTPEDLNSTVYSVAMAPISGGELVGLKQKYVEWSPQDKTAALPNNQQGTIQPPTPAPGTPVPFSQSYTTIGTYTFTPPAGVTTFTIATAGGAGGAYPFNNGGLARGGHGGNVTYTVTNVTTPLTVVVGGGGISGSTLLPNYGQGGSNGGGNGGLGVSAVGAGGGGYTSVDGNAGLDSFFIVAAGGGGAQFNCVGGDGCIGPNGAGGAGFAPPPQQQAFGGIAAFTAGSIATSGTGGFLTFVDENGTPFTPPPTPPFTQGANGISPGGNAPNSAGTSISNGKVGSGGGGGGWGSGAPGGSGYPTYTCPPFATYPATSSAGNAGGSGVLINGVGTTSGVSFATGSNGNTGNQGGDGAVTISWEVIPPTPPVPAPVPFIASQDTSTGYYNCYSPKWWLNCVNAALSECYAELTPAVAGGFAPQFVIDPDTNLISLMCPYIQGLLNFAIGEDVASQSSYLGGPTSRTGANITHALFFNEPLFNLFSSLNTIRYGDNYPILLDATSEATVALIPEGYKIFCNYIQPINYDFTNLQTPAPLSGSSYKWIVATSEYSPVPMWNPLQSIIFTTSMIPVQTSLTNPPQVYGSNQFDLTFSGGGGNNSDISTQISDIQVPLTSGNEYKPTVTYLPRGEYRLLDLLGNTPISQMGFAISYKTKFGLVVPFALGAQCGASLKLVFRRKRFNLGNVTPYDTN
jgi:hypothetical protein